MSSNLINRFVFAACTLACTLLFSSVAVADVANYQNLLNVDGTPDGQFGWSIFSGGYEGPHAPNELSVGGTAALSVSPGGFPPGSSGNLYSFMSVPTYTIALDSLDNNDPFTSVAVQFALGSPLTEGSFSLGGIGPDDFELTSTQVVNVPNIGDVTYFYYWAEWQGLAASDNYEITVQAANQHVSLAGVKVDHFNTSTPYNISAAIPEPGSTMALMIGSICTLAIRRRRK